MVEHLAVNQRVIGSNPINGTRATIQYGTPLYHRIDYLRVFYSAGILRVDWVTVQDTRIIFPPVDLGLKTQAIMSP